MTRDVKDYAIEFGGYLAKAADEFLKHPKDWEYGRALRLAVYEFRKLVDRIKYDGETPDNRSK